MSSRFIKYLVFTICLTVLFLSTSATQAVVGSLTTTVEPTDTRTTLAPNVGYMFDVTAFNALQITSFDINMANINTYSFSVYTKVGTYVGSETNAGAWTLLGTATVTGSGFGNLVNLPIGGLTIPAGQIYGIYVVINDGLPVLMPTLSANTYNNADMQIDAGVELSETSTTLYFGSGAVYLNRTLNVRVNYDTITAGTPPISAPAFFIPNLSEVLITTAQAQPAYMSPNGQVIRNADTSTLMLPNDADGNSFDTYLITNITVVDGETWVALFIGSARWVWIPLGDLQVLRPLLE